MQIIGLTGSIGMGKSATAEIFTRHGIPVHDADQTVHRLYSSTTVPLIEALFPGTTRDGTVQRQKLAECLASDPDRLPELEQLIHPLVRAEEEKFKCWCMKNQKPLAVLDIPLLFETKAHTRCDVIIVVSAPFEVQRQRVLARPGMTEEKLSLVLSRQMPDTEKRRKCHWVVPTTDKAGAERSVQDFLNAVV
jgi:dephospho-CoA kinase